MHTAELRSVGVLTIKAYRDRAAPQLERPFSFELEQELQAGWMGWGMSELLAGSRSWTNTLPALRILELSSRLVRLVRKAGHRLY